MSKNNPAHGWGFDIVYLTLTDPKKSNGRDVDPRDAVRPNDSNPPRVRRVA